VRYWAALGVTVRRSFSGAAFLPLCGERAGEANAGVAFACTDTAAETEPWPNGGGGTPKATLHKNAQMYGGMIPVIL
jgi:hypothetical protein